MEEINAWVFTLEGGVRVVLVSDLAYDRRWMEDETHIDGFTPWMFVYHIDASPAEIKNFDNHPVMLEGKPIWGKSRINLKHVVVVQHQRVMIEGSLSDLR